MRLFLIILASLLWATNVNTQPVFYQETFENARYWPISPNTLINWTSNLENCNGGDTAHGTIYDWTASRVQNIVYRGNNAGRIEVRSNQPLVGSSQRVRSEVTIVKPSDQPKWTPNAWYGFAIYFPTAGSQYSTIRNAINQWFEDGSDETTLRVERSKFFIEVTPPAGVTKLLAYDLFTPTANPGAQSVANMALMKQDEWHEFTFHIIHSFGADGLIDIWRDGVLIHHIVGRNMHLQYPRWKIGIYASGLVNSTVLPYETRQVYFDNIKVGDSTATLADMSSTPQTNLPPISVAGPSQTITLPTSSVTVNGGASSDPDGSISAYLWQRISGPNTPTITSPTTASTTITGLIQGIYTFRLTVTDNFGLVATSSMNVTVNAANIPPTANAGPDQSITLPTSSVTMAGSGNDPDGTIASYLWAKVSGFGGIITTPSSATTTITGLAYGSYSFRLTVTDNNGATGSDIMIVTVDSVVTPFPVANAGSDQSIQLPTNTSTFAGSGTTSSGTITSYLWSKISGPSGGTITTPTSATSGITGLTAGTYIYQLTVTNSFGKSATDLMQIVVLPVPNVPPTANAGTDQSITLPTNTTTLNGSGSSDPDGTITAYAWVKVSGPTGGSITSPSSVNTGITGLTQGTYTYQLTVTDNNGATGSDLIQVVVNPAIPPVNQPPVANAGADQAITLPTTTTTLNGSGSTDPDGTIISYWWQKISGPTGGGLVTPALASTGVIALQAGTYLFMLTVTDNNGDTSNDVMQVLVNPCVRTAPIVSAGVDKTITLPTSSTSVTGTASATNCASISSVLWSKQSGPMGGTIATPTSLTTSITALQAGTYVFKLLATDNNGDTASDVMQVVVNPAPNVPPTVNAGPNIAIVLPINATTITQATATDTDGIIQNITWTKSTGPTNYVITNGNTLFPTISGLVVGTYTFVILVTDSNAATATDSMTITVTSKPVHNPTHFFWPKVINKN